MKDCMDRAHLLLLVDHLFLELLVEAIGENDALLSRLVLVMLLQFDFEPGVSLLFLNLLFRL